SQDLAFPPETPDDGCRVHTRLDYFQRGLFVIRVVITLGEKHSADATMADRPDDSPYSDPIADTPPCRDQLGRFRLDGGPDCSRKTAVRGQHRFHFGAEFRIRTTGIAQVGKPLLRREVDCSCKDVFDLLPAF